MDGLLPIGKARALDFFMQDMSVYAVHPDNSGAEMAFDREDILGHDAMFAVPREEWEQSAEYRARVEARKQDVTGLENTFKAYTSDAFAIYQLKETPETRDRRFEPLAYLRQKDLPVDRKLYELLYTGPIPQSPNGSGNPLSDLYLIFNAQRPADFAGHSLSVSDIVALKQGDAITYHYVDSFGFPEVIREFDNNPLKNAEMAVEDDYGMIDGLINNGKRDDVDEKKLSEKQAPDKKQLPLNKRPSVLEQLKALSRQPSPSPTAPRCAEMER